jgi:hypothetical protein
VVIPGIASRVKEWRQLPCVGVDSSQIGSLVKVAAIASQRKVFRFVAAAVLDRHDMLDVKGYFYEFIYMDVAVFATTVGSLSDKLP